MQEETTLEIFGEGGVNGLRLSKIKYKQPVVIRINGKVVHSNFEVSK